MQNFDSVMINDQDSLHSRLAGDVMKTNRSPDNSSYIKYRVSDRDTMASLQLAASTIMTSRDALHSSITKAPFSIDYNGKELQQVYGSFIHLETDRGGKKPKLLDLSKKIMHSPRRHITGETDILERPMKLRWAPSNNILDNVPNTFRVRSGLGTNGSVTQGLPSPLVGPIKMNMN